MKQLFKVNADGCLVWKSGRPPRVTKANALELSISKWEFIVEWLKKGRQLNEDGSNETCGLCLLYNNPKKEYGPGAACQGCLVRAYTGRQYCAGTPYYTLGIDGVDASALSAVDATTAELEFLQSLHWRSDEGGGGQ